MEVLACPHCDRLFNVTPAVLGKKIRCRGCREIFHVPSDTTSVPLGPPVKTGPASVTEESPPLAIATVKDGREVRSCPACGRTFAMKPALDGKTIRCRGCKAPFRVAAGVEVSAGADEARPLRSPADRPIGGLVAPPGRSIPADSPVRPQPRPPQEPIQPPRREQMSAAASPRPTIFEDIGDVIADLRPGERVASVVRPRKEAALVKPEHEAIMSLIAVVFGAVCAVPLAMTILWLISPAKYVQTVNLLPGFLRDILL